MNNNKTVAYIFILFVYYGVLYGQNIVNIGIYTSSKITQSKFFFQDDYSIQIENDKELIKLNKHQFYSIEVTKDSLIVLNLNGKIITAKKITFYSPNLRIAEFSIQVPQSKKERTYKGHLFVTAENGKLKFINVLDLEDYVCGVVYAEVGKGRHPEFYKAQALLVRTYALSHLYKHLSEGFNLCDQVHCQVYYGNCFSSTISSAVNATQNIVIVDSNLDLIVAAFHSNSGGETINSEDVWGSKKDYLRSVQDTFSIGMPSYRWTKKMELKEWINYLKKNKYPVEDSNALKHALNFKQYHRQIYLQYNTTKLPLKNIRDELKFMSTFFDIQLNATKDSVIFYGRGFGHGVGLSQEGAMRMAKLGLNFQEIIRFYYQNVQFIDLKKLNFFREE